MEQAQTHLGLLVGRHLMLELAALLGEGAGAVVDPLVAVNLLALAQVVVTGQDDGAAAGLASGGRGIDDDVDAGLGRKAEISVIPCSCINS